MRVHTLNRIDTRLIADDPDEIRAFMVVRNEIIRLPQNLCHHRKIGVARFFIVDNGSTDGSREFLLAQPDCHVFTTFNSFSESNCGVNWLNAIIDKYGANRWCLVVDADEWFVYPGYESKPLSALATYLDHNGAQGLLTFLLDMYSHGSISTTGFSENRSLLEVCQYFDRDYKWHRRFYVPLLQNPRFPVYDVAGGPRWRLFFPFLSRHYYVLETMWQIFFYVNFFTGLNPPMTLRRTPLLTKIPFVRWLPGTRYLHNHSTTPIKLAEVTGILLHFKFLGDFYKRIMIEIGRKQHWDDASEYVRYWKKLKRNADLSFHYSNSVAYSDSHQLVDLGLLKQDQGWRQTCSVGGWRELSPDDQVPSPGVGFEQSPTGI